MKLPNLIPILVLEVSIGLLVLAGIKYYEAQMQLLDAEVSMYKETYRAEVLKLNRLKLKRYNPDNCIHLSYKYTAKGNEGLIMQLKPGCKEGFIYPWLKNKKDI